MQYLADQNGSLGNCSDISGLSTAQHADKTCRNKRLLFIVLQQTAVSMVVGLQFYFRNLCYNVYIS